jgi:hypothetical protein
MEQMNESLIQVFREISDGRGGGAWIIPSIPAWA